MRQLILFIFSLIPLLSMGQFSADYFNLKMDDELTANFDKAAENIYYPGNIAMGEKLYDIGFERQDTTTLIAGLLLKLYACVTLGDHEHGIGYAEEIEELANDDEHSLAMFTGWQFDAILRTRANDYAGSLTIARQMSRIAIERQDIYGINMAYYALALVYEFRGSPRTALKYLDVVARGVEAKLIFQFMWPTYYEMAKCYEQIEEYEKAEEYLIRAERAAIFIKNPIVKNRIKTAKLMISCFTKSDMEYVEAVEEAKADTSFYKGVSRNNKLKIESQYLAKKRLKVLALATADSMPRTIESYVNREHIYLFFNDQAGAYRCHKAKTKIQDSLLTAIMQEDINALNSKMDNAVLQIMANDLEKRNSNIIMAGGIFAVVLIAWFIIFWEVNKRKNVMKQQQTLITEVDRQTQELKAANTKQSTLLDEITSMSHDISDSLKYANRIQSERLPDLTAYHRKWISDSFVINRPCNVVSGDFYWAKEVKGSLLVACADCTGHGIKGALMTMIGSLILDEVTKNIEHLEAENVLKKLDEEILKLTGHNQDEMVKDGIEIALAIINRERDTLTIASARRPVFVVKNGKLMEINGIRRSVGERRRKNGNIEFTSMTTTIANGDSVYMLTDGVTSQFGGQDQYGMRGASLQQEGFGKIIEGVSELPFEMQKHEVEQRIARWQGSCCQVDDITIIGIRF